MYWPRSGCRHAIQPPGPGVEHSRPEESVELGVQRRRHVTWTVGGVRHHHGGDGAEGHGHPATAPTSSRAVDHAVLPQGISDWSASAGSHHQSAEYDGAHRTNPRTPHSPGARA
jgi:hypothetical protein